MDLNAATATIALINALLSYAIWTREQPKFAVLNAGAWAGVILSQGGVRAGLSFLGFATILISFFYWTKHLKKQKECP